MPYCPRCGAFMEQPTRFCIQCGSPMPPAVPAPVAVEPAPMPVAAPAAQPVQPPMPPAVPAPVAVEPAPMPVAVPVAQPVHPPMPVEPAPVATEPAPMPVAAPVVQPVQPPMPPVVPAPVAVEPAPMPVAAPVALPVQPPMPPAVPAPVAVEPAPMPVAVPVAQPVQPPMPIESAPEEPKPEKPKKVKVLPIVITCFVTLVLAAMVGLSVWWFSQPSASREEIRYNKGVASLNAGNYAEAYEYLKDAGNYKNAAELRDRFVFRPVDIHSANGDYQVKATYDERGNCIQIDVYYDNSTTPMITRTYTYGDKVGYPASMTISTSDGATFSAYLLYNDKGLLVKAQGKLNGENYNVTYTYDEYDDIVKEVEMAPDGTTFTTEYGYDAYGHIIWKQVKEGNRVVDAYSYTYDAYGNCTSKDFGDGVLLQYNYDDDGNRATKTWSDGTHEFYTYEVFYFENGKPANWNEFMWFFYDKY